MIAMPLLGWGMLSAAAYPLFYSAGGLPAILSQSDSLHALLWDAHFSVAFAFFAVVLLHVAAALFHALVRRDGVFEAMASVLPADEVAPASEIALAKRILQSDAEINCRTSPSAPRGFAQYDQQGVACPPQAEALR